MFFFQPIIYTTLQMKNSEVVLQSIQENADNYHLQTEAMPCAMLPQINTLGCQQKEMGHKGGQR